MSKAKNQNTRASETLNERPEVVQRRPGEPACKAIADIVQALRSSGFSTLDRQAKALGLHRATAWTIIRNKHKVGRLSNKTTTRILTNPETPSAVRAAVRRYLAER